MPEPWTYREPPERPRHAPTQVARPVPWSPQHYSQTEHLKRLAPRLPDAAPPRRQAAFTPATQPRYPRRENQPPVSRPSYPGQEQPRGCYPPPVRQRPPATRPRRKRRVFLWVFLAVQAVFLVWIIAGLASHPAGPTAAQQAAQQCAPTAAGKDCSSLRPTATHTMPWA